MFDNNTKALESFMDYSAMMIAEEGSTSDAYQIYKDNVKDIKKMQKEMMNAYFHKKYDETIKIATNIKKKVTSLKTQVSKVDSTKDKFTTRLFLNMAAVFKVKSSTGGNVDTHYVDDMSKNAPNTMQRSIQEAYNLIMHTCDNYIGWSKHKKG